MDEFSKTLPEEAEDRDKWKEGGQTFAQHEDKNLAKEFLNLKSDVE